MNLTKVVLTILFICNDCYISLVHILATCRHIILCVIQEDVPLYLDSDVKNFKIFTVQSSSDRLIIILFIGLDVPFSYVMLRIELGNEEVLIVRATYI